MPPEAAIWRIDGQQWTPVEALLAVAVERSDLWHQALWEMAARPHLKDPPKEMRHPGTVEIPRPGERRADIAAADVAAPQQEEKPKKDRYQKQRERIAFFT